MRIKQTKERGTKCDITMVRREKGVKFAITLKHKQLRSSINQFCHFSSKVL